jgi:hypothetical protein
LGLIFINHISLQKKLFFHIILPLLVGFFIYLFFHKPNLWIHYEAAKYAFNLNYYESIKRNSLAIFLLNHLPDALWMYSVGTFLCQYVEVFYNQKTQMFLLLFIAAGSEIVQIFFPEQFTFDWIDLFINICISILVIKQMRMAKTKEDLE